MDSRARKRDIELFWLGQAGYLLGLRNGIRVCVDPYLSNSAESDGACVRMWQSGVTAVELSPDLVICTHDHLDHTDPETIKTIYDRSHSVFAGPGTCRKHFSKLGFEDGRIRALDENGVLTLGGAVIRAVHATHTEDSIGVTILDGDTSILITGDTSYSEKLLDSLRGYKVDLLLVCINGKWGNLNVDEACELAKITGARAAVPMHYGLFADNTEDPERFAQICALAGYGGTVYVLTPEERYLYISEEAVLKNIGRDY